MFAISLLPAAAVAAALAVSAPAVSPAASSGCVPDLSRTAAFNRVLMPAPVSFTIQESGHWVLNPDNNSWYFYVGPDYYADGVYEIDGEFYWFAPDGHMLTGWAVNADGTKSYYDHSGRQLRFQWLNDGSNWYFFARDGLLQSGIIAMPEGVYMADENGRLQYGWIDFGPGINGEIYMYADQSGKLAQGWKYIQGLDGQWNWYYFYPSKMAAAGGKQYPNAMARDIDVPLDNPQYHVNADGYWTEQ